MKIILAAVVLIVSVSGSHARSLCEIDLMQAVIHSIGPTAPESLGAMLHRQPTQCSIAEARRRYIRTHRCAFDSDCYWNRWDASPPHQSFGPEHNWRKYQPTQDELNDLDLRDVTRKEAKEIDRLYNQLESTNGSPQVTSNEPQGGDELDETGLAKEIDKENRLLDRTLNICRGC